MIGLVLVIAGITGGALLSIPFGCKTEGPGEIEPCPRWLLAAPLVLAPLALLVIAAALLIG